MLQGTILTRNNHRWQLLQRQGREVRDERKSEVRVPIGQDQVRLLKIMSVWSEGPTERAYINWFGLLDLFFLLAL